MKRFIANHSYYKEEELWLLLNYFIRRVFLKKLKSLKESIESKNRKNIITCGEINNDDIENLDKSSYKIYKDGNLYCSKNIKKWKMMWDQCIRSY